MFKKLLSLILVTVLLCSCFPMPDGWNWGMAPRPVWGVRNFPPATTDYGRGFKAGCVLAFGSIGKGMTSDFTPMYVEPYMAVGSGDYNTGWWDGQEQCTYIFDHDVI